MNRQVDFVRGRRERAWAYGRELRNRLLSDYQRQYGIEVSPPPALIIDELITDFLKAHLRYDPLPKNIFAQTEWIDGQLFVTVNTLTGTIGGVRDATGVENVGKWHEAVHIVDHVDVIPHGLQRTFPGFEMPKVVCYRSGARRLGREGLSREFWAEEAGRAAAVSLPALARSEAFVKLCRLGSTASGPVREGFPLLYEAARDIGVNITALVKQLSFEGWIAVNREGGRQKVYVQPVLVDFVEAA